MQSFFRVTPPTVHQMVVNLEKAGLIVRTPGAPRSIAIRVDPDLLPNLRPSDGQLVKTSVPRY